MSLRSEGEVRSREVRAYDLRFEGEVRLREVRDYEPEI